jgi:streptogramin lyase
MRVRFAVFSHRACVAALAGLALGAPAARAADHTFTEFGVTANSLPTGVALGPDGNVWMAEAGAPGRISKVTTAG